MTTDDENKRRIKFREFINKLSNTNALSDPRTRGKLYTDLRYIYKGTGSVVDFHHYYSDIFIELSKLRNEGNAIIIVGDNLNKLYEYCLTKTDIDLNARVRKFLDHTNLEIARIEYISDIEDKASSVQILDQRLQEISETTEMQKQNVDKLVNSTDNAYSNFISILGIFSAIVLVFFGGTTVFGNIISSMSNTPIFKCILICLLAGIIVFDIIFMFIYFLAKLLGRSIAATFENLYWENLIVRFRKKYPIVFYFNMFGVIGCLICGMIMVVMNTLNMEYNGEKLAFMLKKICYDLYTNNKISFLLFFILILMNCIFALAYVFAKVMDKNIGTVISLYSRTYNWYENVDDKNTYFVYSDGNLVKEFKSSKKAARYVSLINKKGACISYFINFIKRAFFRYPYMAILNTILLFLVFYF